MRRLILCVIIGFLTAASTSEARDLCLNPYIRLSRFKTPSRGQCSPTAGTYYDPSDMGHYGRVSGTVCTQSDGTKLNLFLTRILGSPGSSSTPYVEFDDLDIAIFNRSCAHPPLVAALPDTRREE